MTTPLMHALNRLDASLVKPYDSVGYIIILLGEGEG